MDHYQTLGVQRSATAEEIKKAYHTLSTQHHPDMNGDPVMFKKISEAYETLSDVSKKARYDALSPRSGSSQKPSPKPSPPVNDEPVAGNCTYFGGGSTGRNILAQVKLTPAEMKRGGAKTITIRKRESCQSCAGDGEGMFLCPACRGVKPHVSWCQTCDRSGAIYDKCKRCNGEGVNNWKAKEIKVPFSPGIQVGHSVTILGEGEEAPRKGPGYLRVVFI